MATATLAQAAVEEVTIPGRSGAANTKAVGEAAVAAVAAAAGRAVGRDETTDKG